MFQVKIRKTVQTLIGGKWEGPPQPCPCYSHLQLGNFQEMYNFQLGNHTTIRCTSAREAGALRCHGGRIYEPSEIPSTSRQYSIEGFKVTPQMGSHYADRCEPLRRPMSKIPVRVTTSHKSTQNLPHKSTKNNTPSICPPKCSEADRVSCKRFHFINWDVCASMDCHCGTYIPNSSCHATVACCHATVACCHATVDRNRQHICLVDGFETVPKSCRCRNQYSTCKHLGRVKKRRKISSDGMNKIISPIDYYKNQSFIYELYVASVRRRLLKFKNRKLMEDTEHKLIRKSYFLNQINCTVSKFCLEKHTCKSFRKAELEGTLGMNDENCNRQPNDDGKRSSWLRQRLRKIGISNARKSLSSSTSTLDADDDKYSNLIKLNRINDIFYCACSLHERCFNICDQSYNCRDCFRKQRTIISEMFGSNDLKTRKLASLEAYRKRTNLSKSFTSETQKSAVHVECECQIPTSELEPESVKARLQLGPCGVTNLSHVTKRGGSQLCGRIGCYCTCFTCIETNHNIIYKRKLSSLGGRVYKLNKTMEFRNFMENIWRCLIERHLFVMVFCLIIGFLLGILTQILIGR